MKLNATLATLFIAGSCYAGTPVILPLGGERNPATKTNVVNWLIDGINLYGLNPIGQVTTSSNALQGQITTTSNSLVLSSNSLQTSITTASNALQTAITTTSNALNSVGITTSNALQTSITTTSNQMITASNNLQSVINTKAATNATLYATPGGAFVVDSIGAVGTSMTNYAGTGANGDGLIAGSFTSGRWGGNGGSFIATAGSGGSGSSQTAQSGGMGGNGGSVALTAGTGGNGGPNNGGAGSGGDVTLKPGRPGVQNGSGAAGSPGYVYVDAAAGGSVRVRAYAAVDPSSSSVYAQIYAKTNTTGTGGTIGYAEMYVRDGSGNVTLISPHATDVPEWFMDQWTPNPIITKHYNVYLGQVYYENETRSRWIVQLMAAGTNVNAWEPKYRQTMYVESFDQYNARHGFTNGMDGFLKIENWYVDASAERQAYDAEYQKKSKIFEILSAWYKRGYNDDGEPFTEEPGLPAYNPPPATLPPPEWLYNRGILNER